MISQTATSKASVQPRAELSVVTLPLFGSRNIPRTWTDQHLPGCYTHVLLHTTARSQHFFRSRVSDTHCNSKVRVITGPVPAICSFPPSLANSWYLKPSPVPRPPAPSPELTLTEKTSSLTSDDNKKNAIKATCQFENERHFLPILPALLPIKHLKTLFMQT